MTDVRPLRWLRRQDLVGVWREAFTTTIGIVLLLPVASAVLFGISLHGHFDESIGYRYFNSLRIVYGSEHPWIPQGHFPGLVHELIQIALSAAGWDLDDLGSRVDIFSYAAIAVPLSFTPLAFLWASRPIRSTPLLFLLCTSFLIVVIANPYPWLLGPDYHAWIPALALVS